MVHDAGETGFIAGEPHTDLLEGLRPDAGERVLVVFQLPAGSLGFL